MREGAIRGGGTVVEDRADLLAVAELSHRRAAVSTRREMCSMGRRRRTVGTRSCAAARVVSSPLPVAGPSPRSGGIRAGRAASSGVPVSEANTRSLSRQRGPASSRAVARRARWSLRASVDAAAGQGQGATRFAEALALVAPEGYIWVFVDEGAPFAALCRRCCWAGGWSSCPA
jgi:hypothetical protein